MKRKSANGSRIGYHQLENRWLLAAIANGQEIESSIPIGGSQTFEFQVNQSGPVRFSVGQVQDEGGRPLISVTDPAGDQVEFETLPVLTQGESGSSIEFYATQAGSYDFTLRDAGDDDAIDFQARAFAVVEPFATIVGRDITLTNGAEIDISVARGFMNIYSFNASASTSVLVSAGISPFLSPARLYSSTGETLFSSQNPFTQLPLDLLLNSESDTGYFLVAENQAVDIATSSLRFVSLPGDPQLIPARDVPIPFGPEVAVVDEGPGISIHSIDVTTLGPIRLAARASSPVSIRLYDPSGNPAGTGVAGDNSSGLEIDIVELGQYTALVTAQSSDRFVSVVSLSDPDNSIGLVNGEEQIVNLDSGEEALFTLPVTNSGPVLVSAGDVGDDWAASVSVFAPDGTILVTGEDDQATRVDFNADAPGDYTIIVKSTDGPNDVDFRVRAFVVRDEIILTPGLDGVLGNGTKTSATIGYSSFGVFPIELTQSGRTVLSTSGLEASETTIRLFDAFGNEIEEGGFHSVSDPLLTFVASGNQPQTYTAVVVPRFYDDPNVTFDIRRVSLNEEIAPDADNITLIQNGETISGVHDSGEFAVLQLQTPTSGAVHFAVNEAGLFGRLAVVDADGETILGTDSANNSRISTVQANTNSEGTYYAIVSGPVFSTSNMPRAFNIRGISVPGDPITIEGKDAILQSELLATSQLVDGETGLFLLNVEADDVGPVLLNLNDLDDGSVFSPALSVFGPGGSPVELSSMLGGESSPRVFQADQPGRYYIIVAEADNEFTIQANVLGGDSTLANGDEVVRNAADGRTNVFSFGVNGPGPVYASISAVDFGLLPARISLLDASGVPVPFNDVLSGSNVSPRLIQFDAAAGGQYSVVVDTYAGFAGLVRFRSISTNVVPEAMAGRDQFLENGVPAEQLDALPGALSLFQFDIVRPGTVLLSQFGSGRTTASLFLSAVFDSSGNLIRGFTSGSGMFTAHSAGIHLVVGLTLPGVDDVTIRLIEPNSDAALVPEQETELVVGTELTTKLSERQFSIFPLDVAQSGPLSVFAYTGGSSGLILMGPEGVIEQEYESGAGFRSIALQNITSGSYHVVLHSLSYFSEAQDVRIRTIGSIDDTELFSGRDAMLDAGNEHLTTVITGQTAVFPLVLNQLGPITIYAGATEDLDSALRLTVYDDSGALVATDGELVDSFGSIRSPNVEVTFEALPDKTYFAVVEGDPSRGSEIFDFLFRVVNRSGANILIPDRDLAAGEIGRTGGIVPRGGVSLFNLNVDQIGESRHFFYGPGLTIFDPSGQEIGFDVDDGILTVDADQSGSYLAVVNAEYNRSQFSFGIRPLSSASSNDRSLIDGLDQPLQNGQQITATLPEGGIAIIPLDIDLSDAASALGIRVFNISGTSDGSVFTPFVQIYDSEGNFKADNTRFAPFGSAFAPFVLLPSNQPNELFAVVTSPNSAGPVDYTLRAADFSTPSILLPGQDAVLNNGVPAASNVPFAMIAQFPVEVSTPGTLTVNIDLLPSVGPIPIGATIRLFAPDGRGGFLGRPLTNRTYEYEATEPGTHVITVEHYPDVGFFPPENFQPEDLNFEITVDGISRLKPAVTSFERDRRNSSLEKVLAQPESVEQLTFRFNQDVAIEAEDLVLMNDSTGGTVVDLSGASFNYDASTLSATWDLSTLENRLPAGFYSASFAAGSITSVASGAGMAEDFVGRFHVVLPGDTNFDGDIDISELRTNPLPIQNVGDASSLLANLGRSSGATFATGDFNGDGDVDISQLDFSTGVLRNVGDASILLANLGRSVAPIIESFQRDGEDLDGQDDLLRPDLFETITVRFSQPVSVDKNDLVVSNESSGGVNVNLASVDFSYDVSTDTATWSFAAEISPPLPAGNYSATLLTSAMTFAGSGDSLDSNPDSRIVGDVTHDFQIAIPGDANLDGDVDVSDLRFVDGVLRNFGDASILLSSLGQTFGQNWQSGDLNGDGDVDVSQIDFSTGVVRNVGDASILLANLGQSVVPAAATVSSTAFTSASVTAAREAGSIVFGALSSDQHSLAGSQELDDAFADSSWFGDPVAAGGDKTVSTNAEILAVELGEIDLSLASG